MVDFDYKSTMSSKWDDEHLVRLNLRWWRRRQCSCYPRSKGENVLINMLYERHILVFLLIWII